MVEILRGFTERRDPSTHVGGVVSDDLISAFGGDNLEGKVPTSGGGDPGGGPNYVDVPCGAGVFFVSIIEQVS